MSANNQVLVKEYGGKYFVFDNVMAESWGDGNELYIEYADGPFDTKDDAILHGHKIDETEYGVIEEILCKDGAEVTIKE